MTAHIRVYIVRERERFTLCGAPRTDLDIAYDVAKELGRTALTARNVCRSCIASFEPWTDAVRSGRESFPQEEDVLIAQQCAASACLNPVTSRDRLKGAV